MSSHRSDAQNFEPVTADSRSFGAKIREYRVAAAFTQEELAELAGISTRSVSDLERGLYQAPHRDTVARLAIALRLSAEAAEQLEALVPRQRGPGALAQQPTAGAVSLPTGIVTFLAASSYVSEHSAQALLGQVQLALDEQARVVERCVARNGGTLVPIQGAVEGLLAVFRTASDAVSAAIDIQHVLSEASPSEPMVKLRLGLHTGEADVRDGNYYGSALTRCLRLGSLALGGQTLVSEATTQLVAHALPQGGSLQDVGEHHFGGVLRPERVYQLLTPGTSSDTPLAQPLTPLARHCDIVIHAAIDQRLVFFLGQDTIDDELAHGLATSFGYPAGAPHELARVAQYVSTMAGPGPLYESLHSLLDRNYQPNCLLAFLAGLPRMLADSGFAERYPLIVTTRYDDSLEQAFEAAGEPFDLVTYIADGEQRGQFVHRTPDGRPRVIDRPNKYPRLSENQTIILKVHGAIDRANPEQDSFAVTEDDFLDYMPGDLSSLIPVMVAARLRKSHFLFLGYDVREWNLRVILRRLWGEQRLRYKSWAIHSASPEALERELWRTRDVDVIGVAIDEYVAELEARLATLRPGGQPDG